MLEGAVDGERRRDRVQAMIVSALSNGAVTPERVLGLPEPDVTMLGPPLSDDDETRAARVREHQRMLDEMAERRRIEAHHRWLDEQGMSADG